MTFVQVLELLGYFLRVVGLIVFGLGAGWLTAKVFHGEGFGWQLQVAAFLGLLGAFALVGHWIPGGGAVGGFGLGAGAGLLFWGMVGSRPKGEEESPAKKK
jgi:hypothetical protein